MYDNTGKRFDGIYRQHKDIGEKVVTQSKACRDGAFIHPIGKKYPTLVWLENLFRKCIGCDKFI